MRQRTAGSTGMCFGCCGIEEEEEEKHDEDGEDLKVGLV